MGLMSPELSLDLKPSYVPETINGFLREVSLIGDVTRRLDKVDEFVKRLEDEKKKIEVFKRELPLCMLLLKDAILTLKQESTQYRTRNAYQPVLEEFIPLRKETISGGGNTQKDDTNKNIKANEEDSAKDKKNWMSSVQLWGGDNQNQNHNQSQNLVSGSQKGDDERYKFRSNDLIYPSKSSSGCKGSVPLIPTHPNFSELRRTVAKEEVGVPGLSWLSAEIKHPKQDSNSRGLNSKFGVGSITSSCTPSSNVPSNIRTGHQQPTSRKQRRCWSPELHRRFVDALTQLGGPQVATPKQIRELMRVDDLTNDEVKSHLQKYRLHARRSPNTSTNSTNDQCSDSSKPSSAQSGSPQGPHQFTAGTSTTGGDSMEEDEEDEKCESHSWKGHAHTSTVETDV